MERCRVVPLLLVLGTVVAGACAGARPSPFPRPGEAARPAAGGYPDAATVVRTALSLRGAPYRYGGTDPSGFDCSGFVAYVLARHGLEVPRTVAGQYALGRRVSLQALGPGDLVFFSTVAPGASHVGIVVSPRTFVHAPSSEGVVRVEELDARYWARRFVGARRLTAP